MSQAISVRTRFAPSPSGHLHVGSARTALFNWAYAKAHNGQFILRIEDTDQQRSSDAASMAFLEDLHWLGLKWDEGPEYKDCGGGDVGPYQQSQRLDIYQKYLQQLLDQGKAYRAFETAEELAAAREKARAAKQDYRYDRAALSLDTATVEHYLQEDRPFVIRFKVPDEGSITIQDSVLGDVQIDARELDDFVITKADGFPTYHFAVVVDDALMQISHVIRGQEHLKNTAKHQLLQDALDYARPVYAHISLIFNPDGSKMSKRDQDKALRQYIREHNITSTKSIDNTRWNWWTENKNNQLDFDQAHQLSKELGITLPEINVEDFGRAGYFPEVMVNFLALLGWSPGGDIETFDRSFLVEHFDLNRIIKSPAKFDREKLLAFNLRALQELSPDSFTQFLCDYCRKYNPEILEHFSTEQFALFASANLSRSKTLLDPIQSCRFMFIPDEHVEYETTKGVRKALVNGDPNGFHHLDQIKPLLADLSDWTVDSLDKTLAQYAEDHAGGKLGKVAQPLRIAVSGGTMSPAISETLVLIGQSSTIMRIDHCLSQRETLFVAQ